jgi:hypothetical protein
MKNQRADWLDALTLVLDFSIPARADPEGETK